MKPEDFEDAIRRRPITLSPPVSWRSLTMIVTCAVFVGGLVWALSVALSVKADRFSVEAKASRSELMDVRADVADIEKRLRDVEGAQVGVGTRLLTIDEKLQDLLEEVRRRRRLR